ncbi:trypsin-like peptidase domain-containing protein [Patescibacteria group bacterium]|nr:trypsin-like peptidase domain-containing protein [Patescibacteria group bacterium]
MRRLKPLWYTLPALLTIFVVMAFIGNAHPPTALPYPSVSASSSEISRVSNHPILLATSTPALPSGRTRAASAAASTAQKKTAEPASSISSAEIAQAVSASLNIAADTLRNSLVNIICYSPIGGGLHSVSGSGVLVDPKGIILTNAHIAQYFLLADRGVVCKIRTGSPATDQYTAALMYIPAEWIKDNASVLTEASPSGTGERDFAFVGITGSLTSLPLPTSFPSSPLSEKALVQGAPVVIGSYGAQFLNYSQIQSDLSPTIVFGSIKDVYTFAKNSIDVYALGGSAAAQEGSSGGGVANALGELAGTITTSTMEGATASRQLDAISSTYIRSEYENETGQPLDALLALPISDAISGFVPAAVGLEKVLIAHLPQ